jgi:hypothetical protein
MVEVDSELLNELLKMKTKIIVANDTFNLYCITCICKKRNPTILEYCPSPSNTIFPNRWNNSLCRCNNLYRRRARTIRDTWRCFGDLSDREGTFRWLCPIFWCVYLRLCIFSVLFSCKFHQKDAPDLHSQLAFHPDWTLNNERSLDGQETI